MTPQAPIGEKRRGFRRWKILLVGIVLLPLAGFFLSNLLLTSPWARQWLAGKIAQKTGLETELAGVTWSPWAGLVFKHIELRQPPPLRAAIDKPLLKIDSLQITPVWRAWLRGRLEVRSISLNQPRLTLPLELLAHQTKPQSPAPAPPPQITASAPVPPIAAAPVNPIPQPPIPPPNAQKPPPSPPLPANPTGWIHLKDASFSLVSTSAPQPLFAATRITGSLPIAGDPAQSSIKIGELSVAGQTLAADSQADLDWKAPFLTLKPYNLTINEIKATLALQIAMLSNLPIQISAQIPNQALPILPLPRNGQAKAESFAMNAAFRGLLLAPSTWQGDCLAQAISPWVQFGEHTARFDRGSSVTVLRGGQLSCVDARLMSDDLSILGNATLLASGNAAAACRIVAPPQNLDAIARFVFPGLKSPSLTPLSTHQRAAFDLAAFGNLRQLHVQLGKDGPVLNLKSAP